MKEKYTSGPWKVCDQYTDTKAYPIGHDNGDGSTSIFAECANIGGGVNGGQGLANAHLISAAPELLEALESLVIQLGNQPAGSTVADYCDNARHAIAKARGCA